MAYFDRKDDYGYVRWASEVKRRDHYTCVICGRKGVALNSHHLNAWAEYPDERYDLQNGITLCHTCHESFHDIFGKGKNTVEQFKQFKSIMEELIRAANNEAILATTTQKIIQTAEKDLLVQKIIGELDGYVHNSS